MWNAKRDINIIIRPDDSKRCDKTPKGWQASACPYSVQFLWKSSSELRPRGTKAHSTMVTKRLFISQPLPLQLGLHRRVSCSRMLLFRLSATFTGPPFSPLLSAFFGIIAVYWLHTSVARQRIRPCPVLVLLKSVGWYELNPVDCCRFK